MEGRAAYRIRQGNYRIIYHIKDKVRIVDILDVGDRKEIY
ncbi:type II toxin-antitoxin system RelE/ParE family toxin [Runella sp. CRIBMP]